LPPDADGRPGRIGDAPVSPLPREVVDYFVGLWGGQEGSSRCLHEGTNSSFQFRIGHDDLVLRIHRTGDRTPQEIGAELDWVDYLSRHDVAVARPVCSASGDWVQSAEWQGRLVHAAVFHKARGDHPRLRDVAAWPARLIGRVGRILGRIHALNANYHPAPGRQRFDWPSIDLPRFAAAITPAEDSIYLMNLAAHWKWIQSLSRDDPSVFGLVHGDFQSANLLVADATATVIDFDGSCYNWYLFDIAQFIGTSILNVWSEDAATRRLGAQRVFVEFIRGYSKEHQMKSDWFELLPGFLRGFQLLYYFNLLANFQFDAERREAAPHHDVVRRLVLNDDIVVDLDFRRLYEDVSTRTQFGLFRTR
jgi:Ser/Thr protein kinase RdoA (MazF antagonist)